MGAGATSIMVEYDWIIALPITGYEYPPALQLPSHETIKVQVYRPAFLYLCVIVLSGSCAPGSVVENELPSPNCQRKVGLRVTPTETPNIEAAVVKMELVSVQK